MTKLLTEEEYLSTMSEEMVDATEHAEGVVDIWPYVAHLVKEGLVQQDVYDEAYIELVNRNTEDNFDHLFLPTDDEDTFVVIVVDLEEVEIMGHFVLDLKGE